MLDGPSISQAEGTAEDLIVTQETGNLSATISRLWSIVLRNRWWIILTTCVVSLATITISLLIPDRFRSEATIFIARSTIPQEYVLSNNTANAMEAVDAIKRTVLSRSRLEQIIIDYGLYPSSRKAGAEALAELMRNDIVVEPISRDPERRSMNAFIVAFTSTDPRIAQQVANRVASLFIEESLQKQRQIDNSTTHFLQDQMAAAKAALDTQEALVREYRLKNLGELPEQSAGNLEVLNGLHMQLQSIEVSLARARQERTYLQAMLSHYVLPNRAEATPGSSRAALQQDLLKLRAQREELLARYNQLYPDVVAVEQRIADDEAELNRLASTHRAAQGLDQQPDTAPTLPADPSAYQFRSQLEANTVEIDELQEHAKQLSSQIQTYQTRLTLAPLRQQEFEKIERDYDLAKQAYTNLLNKENQSELATKLDLQQSPDQFQLIDSASFPLKPISPHRQKIALGGLAGGIVLGFALALAIDAKKRSFHSERDVAEFLRVPIVIGIPPLLTPAERQRLGRRIGFEWALGSFVVVMLIAAQWFVHYKG